jgi:hypothetical protein
MPLDINGTYVRPRRLSVAETAKLVRAELKREFPGVKFSVRSSSYSGGASIDVRWTDGPTGKDVDRVLKPYEGARFDGMTDLKYGADHWLCPVHGARTAAIFGNSYDSDSVGVGVGNGPVDSRCCAQAELVSFGLRVRPARAEPGVPGRDRRRAEGEVRHRVQARHLELLRRRSGVPQARQHHEQVISATETLVDRVSGFPLCTTIR